MSECPICNNDVSQKYRPFCSKKCADIDLGKWMTGAYALPSDDELKDEDIDEIERSLKER
ncbi:MAG: DNA gyrase inhibitor YacG [Pseudomonadota bacterium]